MLLFRKMKSKKESETAAWLICAVWAYQSGLGVKNFHLFYYFMRWCPLSSCFFKRFFSATLFVLGVRFIVSLLQILADNPFA